MELLDFWPLSLEVLHLTVEAGVFGDIGGDSKCIFDNCCLEKAQKQKAYVNEQVQTAHSLCRVTKKKNVLQKQTELIKIKKRL